MCTFPKIHLPYVTVQKQSWLQSLFENMYKSKYKNLTKNTVLEVT